MKIAFITLFSLIIAISATGQATFETFIPVGWREIARKDGDVNGDSRMNYDISNDRVLIIEKVDADSKGLRQTSLLVLLGTTTRESFTLYCNSDLAVPDQSTGGFTYKGNNLSIDKKTGVLGVFFNYVAADGTEVMQMNGYKLINKQIQLFTTGQVGVSGETVYTISHDMLEGKLIVEWTESKKSVYKTESVLKVESLPELCTYDGSSRTTELYNLSRRK